MHIKKSINTVFGTAFAAVSLLLTLASLLWAPLTIAKTITIQGADETTAGVIELPESATVNVSVDEDGIILTLPILDVRLRCLGEVNEDGYCYLSAASAGLGTDSDGDGVPDPLDNCPGSGSATYVDSSGCAEDQGDDDSDGVVNGTDQCPNTTPGSSVDSVGCSASQTDGDGDGVLNSQDQCPNTVSGESVNAQGCAASQLDGDGDGVSNALDQCAHTPSNETANQQGCSPSQLDSDGDGVNNATDQCPNTPQGSTVDTQGCEIVTGGGDYCDGAASNVTCSRRCRRG